MQTATINVAGELKKAVDLTPFNLDAERRSALDDCRCSTPNNADDVIFGGWATTSCTARRATTRSRGAEALTDVATRSVLQHAARAGRRLRDGLVRTDWTRPYNPGDMLHFGDDDDPWHATTSRQPRSASSLLYDEYDPRRDDPVQRDGNGSACSNSGTRARRAADVACQCFLNFVLDDDGRVTLRGCVELAPNGTCLAIGDAHSDGNDVIFGDLGNDWLVGGTGRDTSAAAGATTC